MSYKPAKCPDCKSDVQMCCCQAWAKTYQQDKIDVLREALGVASARLDRQDLPASHLVHQAKVMIDEALQKTGGMVDNGYILRIEELEKEVSILREALEDVANYGEKFREPEWYEQTAREALQKVGGA